MAKVQLSVEREAEMKQALADLEELTDQITTLVDVGGLDPLYLEAHNKQIAKANAFLKAFGNGD